eukprot:Opistho-2@66341
MPLVKFQVPLADGKHDVTLFHGTTTGRRIICVDGKEVLRRNYMFSLVGSERVSVGKHKVGISIDSTEDFSYDYTLSVDGKALKRHKEQVRESTATWTFSFRKEKHMITIEKTSLDVFLDGEQIETVSEFIDEGTEQHFRIDGEPCSILIRRTLRRKALGAQKEEVAFTLVVGGKEIDENTSSRFEQDDDD